MRVFRGGKLDAMSDNQSIKISFVIDASNRVSNLLYQETYVPFLIKSNGLLIMALCGNLKKRQQNSLKHKNNFLRTILLLAEPNKIRLH